MDLSRDGRTIVTASHDRTVQRWEADTGRPIGPPMKHERGVFAVELARTVRRS